MPERIVILGGGVAGTLTANLLARELKADARVTVVDPSGMHHYQPGYLYLALGKAQGRWLCRDERQLLRPNVELVIDEAVRVDPEGSVELSHGGSLNWDYLVFATGARLVPELVPGLREASYHFYSLDEAHRLREVLREFRGGRMYVGVAGIPYKCPPAPVEFILMADHYLRDRGIRDRTELTLLSPVNRAFPIESVSKMVQPILDEKRINMMPFFNVEEFDPAAGTITSLEGEKVESDLAIIVPPHRGQQVIVESGLGDLSGWLPTDRHTLQVEGHDRIFAMGDATNLPISKSGSTAHFEAPVVASRIASLVAGTAPKENYGGRVMCFLETGHGKATVLRFDYEHPPAPPAPNAVWHWAKWGLNRLYWQTVPQGRFPDNLPLPIPTGPKESWR